MRALGVLLGLAIGAVVLAILAGTLLGIVGRVFLWVIGVKV